MDNQETAATAADVSTAVGESLVLGATVDPVVDLTAGIASAFLAQNRIDIEKLPTLLSTIHGSLSGLNTPAAPAEETTASADAKTAAEIKKSIKHDHLVSFIDGKQYKTLKRHLARHGMTPEAYRAKFGLSPDYPMVAQVYSEQRSSLAKASGLGQRGLGQRATAAKAA